MRVLSDAFDTGVKCMAGKRRAMEMLIDFDSKMTAQGCDVILCPSALMPATKKVRNAFLI